MKLVCLLKLSCHPLAVCINSADFSFRGPKLASCRGQMSKADLEQDKCSQRTHCRAKSCHLLYTPMFWAQGQLHSAKTYLGAFQRLCPSELGHNLMQAVPGQHKKHESFNPLRSILTPQPPVGARKSEGKVTQQALEGKGIAVTLFPSTLAGFEHF